MVEPASLILRMLVVFTYASTRMRKNHDRNNNKNNDKKRFIFNLHRSSSREPRGCGTSTCIRGNSKTWREAKNEKKNFLGIRGGGGKLVGGERLELLLL